VHACARAIRNIQENQQGQKQNDRHQLPVYAAGILFHENINAVKKNSEALFFFFSYGAAALLGPWRLQSSASRHPAVFISCQ
jgi:hypothetical protein